MPLTWEGDKARGLGQVEGERFQARLGGRAAPGRSAGAGGSRATADLSFSHMGIMVKPTCCEGPWGGTVCPGHCSSSINTLYSVFLKLSSPHLGHSWRCGYAGGVSEQSIHMPLPFCGVPKGINMEGRSKTERETWPGLVLPLFPAPSLLLPSALSGGGRAVASD